MTSSKKDNAPPVHENLLMKERDSSSSNLSESDDSDSETSGRRTTWGKKAEYFLSVIGYCVGLGNIWRFPYVCMRNGGGAFLIPFFLALFLCAYPLYFLEMALAQFVGKGPWHVWNICPLFRGIGMSMNFMCLIVGWYYSMILAWCLIYMVNAFRNPLPWTQCGQWWNTENCHSPESFRARATNDTVFNSTLAATVSLANGSTGLMDNGSTGLMDNGFTGLMDNGTVVDVVAEGAKNATAVSSTEEFWLHNVLEITSGIGEMGGVPWHTAVALAAANLIILVAVIKGIHSSGKVVYVTATLPYLLLGVILIMGCTLPGSGDGLLFYIKPDFSKLLKFQTWVEASIQVFYSLGPGWGCLITMASYNKFHYNCLRDSIILVIVCEGTSIFGGFAIFSILGHMAHVAQVPIMTFAKSGAGLAFIVYPEAISYLPVPQLWGFLFFLMLFTVGLDSQFGNVETLITTLADIWPSFMRRWRVGATMICMTIFALSGLVFAARGGGYVFQIIDWYIAAFTILIQATLELVSVAWLYGADRFCYDVQLMVGRRPPYYLVFSWKYVCPVLLMLLFFFTLAFYEPPTFAGFHYPVYAQVIGWGIAVFPFLFILGYAIYLLVKAEGSLLQRLKSTTAPPKDWGPSNHRARQKYHYEPVSADQECKFPCGGQV